MRFPLIFKLAIWFNKIDIEIKSPFNAFFYAIQFDGYVYANVSGNVEWKCGAGWVISGDRLE